jgi:hypothetical protein
VRIFGYLATVLANAEQKDWAKAERDRANQARNSVADLRQKLDQARAQSVSLPAELIAKLAPGSKGELAADVVAVWRKNNKAEIEELHKRISEAEGPPCESGGPTAQKK